jgi:hypothetical protein
VVISRSMDVNNASERCCKDREVFLGCSELYVLVVSPARGARPIAGNRPVSCGAMTSG